MAKLYTFLFAVCAWQVAASSPLLGGLASNPLGSVQGLLANPLGALNGGIAKNSPFFNDLKNIASSKLAAAKNFGLNALNNVRSRVGAKFGAAPAVAAEAAPAVEAAVVTAEVTPEVDVEAAIVKRSPFFNDLKNIATSKLAAAKNFGLNALNNVRSRVGAKFGAAPAVAAEAAPAVEAAVVAAEVAPEVAVDSEVDVEAAIVKRSPFFNDLKNIATSKLAAAKNFGLNALNNVRSRVGAKFGAAPAVAAEAAPAVEAAVVTAEVAPEVAVDSEVDVEAAIVKRSPFFNDLKNIATSKLAAAKNFGLNALNNVRSRVGAKFGAAPAVAAEAAPAVEASVVAAEVAPEVAVDSEVDVEAAIVKRSPFFNDLKNIATSKLAAAKNFGLNALNNVRSRVGAKFGAAPAIVAEAAPAVEAAVVAAEVVPALLDVAADTANVEVEATVAA